MAGLKNPSNFTMICFAAYMHLTAQTKTICGMWAQRPNQIVIGFKATCSYWTVTTIQKMTDWSDDFYK
jgi:hypothetical protein